MSICKECKGTQNRVKFIKGKPVFRHCRKCGGSGVSASGRFGDKEIRIHKLELNK